MPVELLIREQEQKTGHMNPQDVRNEIIKIGKPITQWVLGLKSMKEIIQENAAHKRPLTNNSDDSGMIMNDAIFTIDPLGKIYKCPALVGREQFAVGDIDTGETRHAVPDGLWQRCCDCVYLPLCGVGCLYAAYVRFGDPLALNCQKDYLDTVVRENLKLNYLFSRKKTT